MWMCEGRSCGVVRAGHVDVCEAVICCVRDGQGDV